MIKRAKNILLNEDAYLKTSFSTPWVISSQLNERETIFIPLRYFVRQTRQTRFPWTKHYYLPLHFHRNSKIHKFWNAFEKFIPSNSSSVVQMKNSPNQGEIAVDGKMDNFWFSDDAGLERKHEGITSRLKESWAREMLVGVSSSRVTKCPAKFLKDSKRRVCRLDEIRAAKRERATTTKSCGITFSLPRWMQKRPRVYPKYRTAQISRSCSRFFPPSLLSIGWSSAKNTFTLLKF